MNPSCEGDIIKVLEKIVDWTLDKYIGVGLVLTLFLSMLLGYDSIQGNIISGLIGYMSKTVMVEKEGIVNVREGKKRSRKSK